MWPAFDLLFISEPAQIGSRLAALSDACQSDVVSLHGRLRQTIDLWLLWNTWGIEQKSPPFNQFSRSGKSLHNNNIIIPWMPWKFSSSSKPCREIREQTKETYFLWYWGIERLLSPPQLKMQQNELSVVCHAHGLEKFNDVKNSTAMYLMKKTKQTNALVSLHRLQCPLKLFSIAEIVPIMTESIQKQTICCFSLCVNMCTREGGCEVHYCPFLQWVF